VLAATHYYLRPTQFAYTNLTLFTLKLPLILAGIIYSNHLPLSFYKEKQKFYFIFQTQFKFVLTQPESEVIIDGGNAIHF
jgi:hypothetical protein